MPNKKRRDLITTNARGGLRFRLLAAIADIPELRRLSITTALTWLADYALDTLYRGRQMTLPKLIEGKMSDKRFPWGELEGDPNAQMALLGEISDIEVERLWAILKGEASPSEEDISGLASAFEMEVADVVEIAQGRGPRINGEAGIHAERH